jgi:hypothetical protein
MAGGVLMTLLEATVLAIQIAKRTDMEVHAIGRFLPVEDLKPDTPWRISVIVYGADRPQMINHQLDLEKFDRKPEPKPATVEAPRRLVNSQPALFD